MAQFLFVVIAIMLLFALANPFVGLLGLLILNILRPGEIYPIFASLHVERVMAIVVMAALLFHERRIALPKITKTVLFFYVTMWLSVPFSYWKANALSATLEFGQTVIYHLLIVTLLTSEKRFKTFVITFAGLLGWLAASSLYLYMNGSLIVAMGIERAEGLTSAGGDPNTLGLTLVSGLPLVALLMVKDSSIWLKLAGLAMAAVSLVTIVNTGSRMSFFSFVFLIGIFVLTRKKRFVYIPIAVALMAVAWLAVPQQYKVRYESVKSLEKDESYQNRLLAWQAGWEMFKDNPVTGVGPANFAIAAGSEYWPGEGRKHWLNAHSLPLKLIGELGIVGTVAFIFMLWTLFKLNFHLKKEMQDITDWPGIVRHFPMACNMALLVLLVAGYSSHNLYRSTWYMLASMSGALELLLIERKGKVLAGDFAESESDPLNSGHELEVSGG